MCLVWIKYVFHTVTINQSTQNINKKIHYEINIRNLLPDVVFVGGGPGSGKVLSF